MNETKRLVLGALLISISLVLGFTGWGFIPLPLPILAGTIFHIPVILAGILLGPGYGFLTGCVFGIFAVQQFPAFPWFVLFPGRPLIGLAASGGFLLLSRWDKSKIIAVVTASVLGSLTNSVITLGLGSFFKVLAPELTIWENVKIAFTFSPVVLTEAALAVILVPAIYSAWKAYAHHGLPQKPLRKE